MPSPAVSSVPGSSNVSNCSAIRWNSLYGVAASLALHAAALSLLFLLHLPVSTFQPADPVSSRWSPTEEPPLALEPELTIAPIRTERPRQASAAAQSAAEASPAGLPELQFEVAADLIEVEPTGPNHSRTGARKARSGNGQGAGRGTGGGQPFFDVPGPGESIVFIVDNSRSMNHPHDSEFKTRFRRVKAELLKCIALMPADGRFSVIFFAREVFPLPAPGLRTADPVTKEAALRWVGAMDAGGSPTDPRKALALGLRLQPDRIYFLTDGEFERAANLTLLKLRQERTIIDTFAFGERLGEDLLRQLAEHNRGRYTFVP